MMKQVILCLTMVLAAIAADAQQYYGKVQDADGYTNIRRGPSTNAAIVRQYNSGDYLYYTPLDNGWSKVYSAKKASSFMGYMSTSRIVRINPNNPTRTEPNYTLGYITDPTDTYVNVRRGPGTKYAICGRLNIGDAVYFQDAGNGWVKIFNNKKQHVGYVAKSRITTRK